MTEPSTPLMRQYHAIKTRYPHALVLFRLGDFYELFYEDAIAASRELQITLTSRNRERGEPVPMCGVPYHAAEGYIARLLRAGYKIAAINPTCSLMMRKEYPNLLAGAEVKEFAAAVVDSHELLYELRRAGIRKRLIEDLEAMAGLQTRPIGHAERHVLVVVDDRAAIGHVSTPCAFIRAAP
jgi:hypothetical protein